MTLEDVASSAGVSPKTVSRVLNNEPNVRETTRKKVLSAARKLGYKPNPAARSLAGSKSYTIAHLHDNPDQDYISRANSGIYEKCKELNYFLLLEPLSTTESDLVKRVESFLEASRVDGVILSPPSTDFEPLTTILSSKGIPTVAISPGKQRDCVASVFIDERKAAEVMTRHLIGLGHRDIAFIAGPSEHESATSRVEGYRIAMRQAGLKVDNYPVEQGDFSFKSGMEAAKNLLSLKSRPTAIFAANDVMAAGAMTAVFQHGLSVPVDISIAGFDASYVGSILWPPLCTVRQPVTAMARTAAQWLIADDLTDENGDAKRIQFEFELVDRASAAKPTT